MVGKQIYTMKREGSLPPRSPGAPHPHPRDFTFKISPTFRKAGPGLPATRPPPALLLPQAPNASNIPGCVLCTWCCAQTLQNEFSTKWLNKEVLSSFSNVKKL